MVKVYAKCDCGCCTTEMKFHDLHSAKRAFDEVGYGNGMIITDDAGQRHEGIDTFYGFSVEEREQKGRSLGYLASRLG